MVVPARSPAAHWSMTQISAKPTTDVHRFSHRSSRRLEVTRPRPRFYARACAVLTRAGGLAHSSSAASRMMSRDGPRPTRSPLDAQARVLARRAATAVHCTERMHGTATQDHAARALHGEAVSGRKPLRLRQFGQIGAAGFEPTTSCSQSRRSTKLSYAPRGEQCTACGARFPDGSRIPARHRHSAAAPCAPPPASDESECP